MYRYVAVLAAEKVYQDFTLTTANQGGHSSRPTPDNAIYQLAHALDEDRGAFSSRSSSTTPRARYFAKFGAIEGGEKGADMIAAAKNGDAAAIERLRKDPSTNAILRTNCVATQLAGGHAPNALPQRATANVNCRIFPGHAPEEIRAGADRGHRRSGREGRIPVAAGNARRAAAAVARSDGPDRGAVEGHVPGRRGDPDDVRRARPTAASSRPPAFRRMACPACWATARPATRTASTNASACRR